MRLRLNYPFKHRIRINVTHSTDVLFQSAESMHCPSHISSLWQWCQRLRGRVLPLPWALPPVVGNAAQSCPWLALPSLEDPARSSCGGLFEKIRGSCHSGQSPSRYLTYLCQSLSSLHILLYRWQGGPSFWQPWKGRAREQESAGILNGAQAIC